MLLVSVLNTKKNGSNIFNFSVIFINIEQKSVLSDLDDVSGFVFFLNLEVPSLIFFLEDPDLVNIRPDPKLCFQPGLATSWSIQNLAPYSSSSTGQIRFGFLPPGVVADAAAVAASLGVVFLPKRLSSI